MRRKCALALALAAALLLAACSASLERVLPYERGAFAEDKMLFSPIGARAEFEGHVFGIREGSRGGTGTPEGGCGCK